MNNSKVVICQKCKGKGEVIVEYFKSKKDPHAATCEKCLGSGRLLRTVTVEHTPIHNLGLGCLEHICKPETYEHEIF